MSGTKAFSPEEVVASITDGLSVTDLNSACYAMGTLDNFEQAVKAQFAGRRENYARIMRTRAAEIYTKCEAEKAQAVAAGLEFNLLAADAFATEAKTAEALAMQKGIAEKALKNWRQYSANLKRAMVLSTEGEFVERDENGDFVLGGMNALTSWCKTKEEEVANAALAARTKAAKEAGLSHLAEAPKSESKAEAKAGGEGAAPKLDTEGLDPEVQAALEAAVIYLLDLQKVDKKKAVDLLSGLTSKLSNLCNIQYKGALAAVREAAAA